MVGEKGARSMHSDENWIEQKLQGRTQGVTPCRDLRLSKGRIRVSGGHRNAYAHILTMRL